MEDFCSFYLMTDISSDSQLLSALALYFKMYTIMSPINKKAKKFPILLLSSQACKSPSGQGQLKWTRQSSSSLNNIQTVSNLQMD